MLTRPRLAALVLLAPLAGAAFGAAAAEPDFQATVAQAREADFQGYLPVAQLSEIVGFDKSWSVNTFYVIWTGKRPALTAHFVARRQTGGLALSTTERWADSRTCQALVPTLTAMEQLPDARVDIPDLGREVPETPRLLPAGLRLTLWAHGARAGADEALVDLEISGSADTPMAKWWSETQQALGACWKPDRPTT
ncbi:hypothetical protein [Caulobacter mirabilis]|uniref:Uncharacterized protein n=1 Tax=Caulobacter mirabilis TaxID=69666 RepID=A0A2D2AXY3_9CAUL|nr:hypothetical protein [Caulobacter mirabilis]ATQ42833.1 hypothetical protein CSW64_10640 [Caulobacter mirabilis]